VPENYTSVQAAINAADTWDIIFVRSGVYYENLILNKTVILLGEDPATTIIDGGGGNAPVITVLADSVQIEKITVRGGEKGIYASVGIWLKNVKYCRIVSNYIVSNFRGIVLEDSSNNTISGNLISKNEDVGVLLAAVTSFCSMNYIYGNIITENGKGEAVYGAGIHFTIVPIDGGIFGSCQLNYIYENDIKSNNFGVKLGAFCKNNKFFHNNFIDNIYQACASDDANLWDSSYPYGGNYWNDYVGVDEKSGVNQDQAEGDGIGDDPYVINQNNVDRYPLITSFVNYVRIVSVDAPSVAALSSNVTINVYITYSFPKRGGYFNIFIGVLGTEASWIAQNDDWYTAKYAGNGEKNFNIKLSPSYEGELNYQIYAYYKVSDGEWVLSDTKDFILTAYGWQCFHENLTLNIQDDGKIFITETSSWTRLGKKLDLRLVNWTEVWCIIPYVEAYNIQIKDISFGGDYIINNVVRNETGTFINFKEAPYTWQGVVEVGQTYGYEITYETFSLTEKEGSLWVIRLDNQFVQNPEFASGKEPVDPYEIWRYFTINFILPQNVDLIEANSNQLPPKISQKDNRQVITFSGTNSLPTNYGPFEIKFILKSNNYILHVQSSPITGVHIGYTGDYLGGDSTNFVIGPKESPFTVILTAPQVYQDYIFDHWELDGINMGGSLTLTVKIDDEKRERTAVAVYSKEVIEYTLHVKSEPVLGVSISYSGDYSGTGTTSFDIGPKNSCFRVVLAAPSEFQNYKFVYWYIPELKLITVENPFICYHLKAYTSFNELTAIAVFSKDTSVIDLKTVPVDYTGVITLVERGFEEYAGTQELKFNVDQKLTNLIAWFYISRYNWHPEGPLSTPKEYPNINFNIRISSPQGTEYSVTMNTSRGFTDVWIPIPEPAQGSWTMKIIAFTEDSVSTKCKYSLSIREDKSSIVKPLTVINLKTGKAEEKFGCSLWVQARSKYEKVNPLMPSHKEPFAYYISTTLHSDLGLEKNFPNILAVGFDDALGSICDKPVLCIDRGKSEGYEEIVSLTEDPNVEFAAKWSFEIVKILSSIVEYGTDIVEFLEDLHGLYVQEIFKPVVKEAFTLYEKLDENKLDLINFDVPASLNGWSSSDRTRRFWTYCNLSLAPSSDFIIYTCLALLHESGEYYYIKPQTFEFKISGTTLGATYANVKSNNGMETLISHEDTVMSNTSILTYQHNSSRHVMLATSSEEVTDLGSVPLQYTGTMKLEVGLGGQRIGDEYFSFDVPQDFENIIVEVNILADGATPDLDSVDVFVYDEQRKITYEAEVFPREKSDMAIAIPQPKQFGQKWGISIYAWAPLWTSSFRYSIKVEEDPNSIVKPLTLINAETKQPDAQYGSGASLWIQAKDLQTNKPIHPLKLPAHGEVEYTMIIQLPASCWIIEDYPNVVSLAYDDVLGEIKMDKAASREIGWEAGWRDANVAKDQYVQFALKWGVVYPISKIPVIGTYISFIELLKDLFDLKIKDYYKQAVEKSYNLYKTAMNENQFDIINFFIPARLTWYDYAYMAKFIVPLKLSPTSSLRIFLTLAAKYQNPVKTTYYYVEPQYFDFSISGTKVSLQEQQHKIHLKVYDDMGNCIGFDPSIGRTKEEIEGARYIDFMNGTTIIVIPPEYKDLQIIVDASNAEEQQEYYNLTITYITQNGSQIANNFQGVICKNELQKLKVNISGSSINIEEIKEAIPWWIQHQLWIIAGVMVAAVVATATFALIRKQKRYKTKVNL
jgi:parallel beta-helix repeat protein